MRNTKESGLFFLDSGAHSLFNKYVFKDKKRHTKDRFWYYETKEFWDYVDSYAEFIKNHKDVIDYYVNVDVISSPELSWKVLKYLETKHGLSPIPVIHAHAPLETVSRHLEAGYDMIGLGGVALEGTSEGYVRWADQVFRMICPAPSYLPTVKVHGFAMTGYSLMLRYPWYSVDSASWTKVGANGGILIPHKRQGKFTFGEQPYVMPVSVDAPTAKQTGKHYYTLTKAEQAIVREWLECIDVPLGKGTIKKGTMEPETPDAEPGVVNHHSFRKVANLLFYEGLREWLDIEKGPYPWPFTARVKKGWFGC